MAYAELAFYATAGAYALACVLFLVYLVPHPARHAGPPLTHRWTPQRSEWAGLAAPRVVAVGAAAHALHLVASSVTAHVCPIRSVNLAVSFASLLGVLIYLALLRNDTIRILGAFLAPAALVFVLGSRVVSRHESRASTGLLALHVTTNLLGDALFLLASAAAILYLVEERRIKHGRAASVFGRLPPLSALDRAGYWFLLAGFPLLTAGIITGTVGGRPWQTGGSAEIMRAVFAGATWAVFAGVLVLRSVLGWHGRRAAYGTLAGFAFAVAVLIVYLVRSTQGGPA